MQTKNCRAYAVLVMLAISILNSQFSMCHAQGTAFTYQGRLNVNGGPANGLYDFRFKLYFDSLGNTQVGSSYFTNGIPANNGLFTAPVDFGPGIFNGSNYWLEVDVRTNNGGSYTALSPLQGVTPTPYAVFASSASNLSGTVSSASISGTYGNAVTLNNSANSFAGSFTGNGANVTNVNAVTLNGYSAGNFWQLGGNAVTANQFLGTTNNQSLAILVAGQRALLITTNPADSANFIGGSPANVVDPGIEGAVIAGGGTTNYSGSPSSNHVSANFGVIGGGSGNSIQSGADHSAIVGGWNNLIASNNYESVIAGGENNTNNSQWAFIGSGLGNNITSAANSAIAGGDANIIEPGAFDSFIGSGYENIIQTNSNNSIIGSGWQNTIQQNDYEATIAGGWTNTIQSNNDQSTIGGGEGNVIQYNAYISTISGGIDNLVQSNAQGAVIGGGYLNTNGGYLSAILGGQQNTIQLQANYSAIVGGYGNIAFGFAGGGGNVFDFIGGGTANTIWTGAFSSVIGGGQQNSIGTNADHSAIGGGWANTIGQNDYEGVIAGGYVDSMGDFSGYSAIGGGQYNVIGTNSPNSVIPGGANNVIGNYAADAFAAGQQAQALNQGAFVWADSQNAPFFSTGNDQFLIRAQGGVGINTTNPIGATLAINTGGAGMILMRNEGNLIPALVTTSSNGYSGWLRFRNVLEVFPNDAGTSMGYVDVRNTNGITISLDGSTGFVTASNFFGNGASLTALNANNITSGTIGLAQLPAMVLTNTATNVTLSGTFSGNGANLTNVNAATLNGLNATNFWQTGGNSSTTAGANYLGTSDNQPLELHVNGARALRLETTVGGTGVPNVIGGYSGNLVDNGSQAVTIGGGGASGVINHVSASLGTIGGGSGNDLNTNANDSTISGGRQNTIDTNAWGAVIGGGHGNWVQAGNSGGGSLGNTSYSVIGGGYGNVVGVNVFNSVIGGGGINTNSGSYAVVPGGYENLASGQYSFAAGQRAQALHQGAFVWADSQSAAFASTAVNQFNVRAGGGVRFVTGGAGMTLDGVEVLTNNTSGVTLAGSFSGGLIGSATSATNFSGSLNGDVTGPQGSTVVSQVGGQTAANVAGGAILANSLLLTNTAVNDFFAGPFAGRATTGGQNNTGIGAYALQRDTGGSFNTAVGFDSLHYISVGAQNTALGYFALGFLGNAPSSTGTNNIGIGYLAGVNLAASEINNIEIGNQGVNGENNMIRIGTPGTQTNTVIAGVVTAVGGLQIGTIGTTNGTAITFMESGQAIMNSASTQETNFTIAFPTAFTSTPKIIFTIANDPGFQGVSDVFASSVSSNSVAAFSINVYRLNGTGWSQNLRVNWQAWQ